MSGVAARIIRTIAITLPARARDRYREEWIADLNGAAEVGVSPASVVLGAFTTAVTMDRIAPETSGLTLGRLFTHRTRLALAFLVAAAVPAAGHYLYGGYQGFGGPTAALGVAALVVAILLAVAGTVALLSALRVALRARRAVVATVMTAGPLVVAIILLSAPVLVWGSAMLLAPVLLLALAVLIVLGSGGRATLSRPCRVLVATPFAVVAVAACALGILHITVWNPLARMPALTLDEIYAGLADAGEATGTGTGIIVWAVVTVLGAGGLIVLAAGTRTGSTRRIIASGLLLIAGTTALGLLAGFGMGMGLADAFATSGGDAAASGPILAITGQLALTAAIIAAFVRDSLAPGEPEPGPSAPVEAGGAA